jgi:hypothetical protein
MAVDQLGIRDQALARLHLPVDSARAVWRGLVLVGHRRSIQAGHMFWALPGRGFAEAITLKQYDPAFQVLNQPGKQWLVDQQPVLKELNS